MTALGRRLEAPDASHDDYATYLSTASGLAAIAAGKAQRDRLLGLSPGGAVLEVGCGLGDDAARLVALVGPAGRVVGADVSAAMIEHAASNHPDAEFVAADAHALPFADATFDAARVERALQHMRDPAVAVGELTRVVRPGGTVVACEPDWATIAISGPRQDVVDAVRSAAEDAIRHPRIGRELAGLLVDAGAHDVDVAAEAVVVRELALLEVLADLPALVGAMRDDGAVPGDELDALLDALRADADAGRLVCVTTLVTVRGTVA